MSDEHADSNSLDNRWQPLAEVGIRSPGPNWLKIALIITGVVAFGILDALALSR